MPVKVKTRYARCFGFLLILMSFAGYTQVWTPVAGVGTAEDLKTTKFIDASTGWVAGSNGTILKTVDGGANWSPQNSGTDKTIRSIYFTDASNGWACGDGGTIISTVNGGSTWTTQSSPYTSQYRCIRFANNNTGWLVGQGNVLLKTINGGATWTQQMNQGSEMWGLEIQSTTSGWVGGGFNSVQGSPTLLKTINGTNWVYQGNSGVSSFISYNDIRFPDASNGWIVGGNGIIRHTTDAGATTWTGQTSGTQYELLGVDFINSSIGYACGRQGIIIASSNGGSTWVAQSTGTTSATLWEVDMIDVNTGFAVGDNGLILRYTSYSPVQPIVLLQPTIGGDIFQVASKRFIIWQAQPGISNVKIEYSTTGNNGPWTTIVASTNAAAGSYAWSVPNTPSVNCFIRVSNTTNSNTNTVSAAPFYILNSPYGIDYSVLTSATVSNTPAQITVSWANDVNALSYTIDRRLPSDTSWSNLIMLAGSTSSYTDNDVVEGIKYEYRVVKTTPLLTGYGYVYAGINIPAAENRGTMLLAVDSTIATGITPELDQFRKDLVGDGWKLVQKNFATETKDTAVKNWVKSEYNKPGSTVKGLLLIGHFAIPYSGNFAPDGHAERVGAQPADVYYADLDGSWTDNSVTTTTTGNVHTSNMPGDGRWDQSKIPSPVELQVGRIDMHDMTGFALNETDLIKQYLNKDHAFRHKIINPSRRALINTVLDNQLINTSAVAWRSFSPMFGSDKLATLNSSGCSGNGSCSAFIDSLQANSYLWTYMAGGGTDTSCADPVLTSSQCINKTINTVFMQLYGSYFVEWAKGGITGTKNHLLRAPLANSGMPLVTCWTGGAPRWYFHHMGLGETIGYSAMQSQNNAGIYDPGNNNLTGGVHMAIMGDPSLRLHAVYPVSSLTVKQLGVVLQLNWNASADDNIIGYHIYRSDTISGDFTRLNVMPVISTQFIDTSPGDASNIYMVRTVKLETSPSGSYQNMSEGIFISAAVDHVFTFNGNGNWSDSSNWLNNLVPPSTLPAGFQIIISPPGGGICNLDIEQHILTGASLTVSPGKTFIVNSLLMQ